MKAPGFAGGWLLVAVKIDYAALSDANRRLPEAGAQDKTGAARGVDGVANRGRELEGGCGHLGRRAAQLSGASLCQRLRADGGADAGRQFQVAASARPVSALNQSKCLPTQGQSQLNRRNRVGQNLALGAR